MYAYRFAPELGHALTLRLLLPPQKASFGSHARALATAQSILATRINNESIKVER